RLSVNFRDDPLDRHDVNFDGSYGAVAFGNWMLFAGRVEQWWGPGWDSALLLSNNARPMPLIGLGRLEAKPFESRWLRWIGPWNLRMFAGRKSKNRNDFPHPFEVGYRVDFQPTRWMSWGLTYMVQFCGQGRPCSFTSIRKAVLPFPNQTNTRANKNRLQNDPGDAQAGWDVSFQGTLAGLGWTLYTEQAFEDQIEDTIALYGATLTGRTGLLGGAQWRFVGEMADTFGDRTSIVFRKSKGQPFIYQNSIFTDGPTYRGRILGASLDFNSLLVTGRLMLQFDAGPSWELMVRHADINRPEAGGSIRPHLISANRERINILETRLIWPTERFGQIRLEAGLADDAPNTPGRSPTKGRVEVGWSYGF
ncbi:MAG: capsule assembly Wzi family protein, partial [Candidatus Zixiibacteriota bacterium]